MIKYLELALSQEVYEYLEELDQMNWSARGNVLNQYLRNTSIGTTVNVYSEVWEAIQWESYLCIPEDISCQSHYSILNYIELYHAFI